jgi:LEA14-like dessication related protein
MIRKIFLTTLVLILVSIALFFIWLYVDFARNKNPHKTFLLPRIELSIVEITSLTNEKIEMTVKMLIKNQLPISFTADSLQYAISIDGVEVIKSHHIKSIKLESNDSSWVSLPITILSNDLKSILNSNESKNMDSVEYRLQASFYTNIVFRKKFDVDIKKDLPMIYLPEVTIEHMHIDSINFSRAAIRLLVSIKNQNLFPLEAKNMAYKFAIEEHEWIEGVIPGLTNIKAQSDTELQIPISISFKEVTKTLFDLLKKGNNVKYDLHLTFRVESENHMIQDSKVILESAGTVKSLMKAAKKQNP